MTKINPTHNQPKSTLREKIGMIIDMYFEPNVVLDKNGKAVMYHISPDEKKDLEKDLIIFVNRQDLERAGEYLNHLKIIVSDRVSDKDNLLGWYDLWQEIKRLEQALKQEFREVE